MLTALSYHQKVKDHFRQQSRTWDFFNVPQQKNEQLQEFKTELLKNSYKFDPATEPALYEKINLAKEKLELHHLPVTVYQSQFTDELNAGIVYLYNEAHIVFSGPVLKLLDEDELLAVLAHELTHIKLYGMLNGELEVADRIITSIANNHQSDPAYYETARLFRLYTEVFCDRGACQVTGTIEPVISSLVKISTGLEKVHAASYLRQADEIFSNEKELRTGGLSHPENFIRAKAIQLWQEKGEAAEEEIMRMMEGLSHLDQLDIFRQQELSVLTRKLLQLFLKPKWFRTGLVSSQARQYFADFSWDESALLESRLVEQLMKEHASIKEYFAYVLLDFVLVDPSLEEIPAGWAYQFAEEIGIRPAFDAIIKKELQLSDKKFSQQRQTSLNAYYQVKENDSEQIYQ